MHNLLYQNTRSIKETIGKKITLMDKYKGLPSTETCPVIGIIHVTLKSSHFHITNGQFSNILYRILITIRHFQLEYDSVCPSLISITQYYFYTFFLSTSQLQSLSQIKIKYINLQYQISSFI